MGYVPLIPKTGFQLKIEETELTRKIYVRNETAIWINEYSRTKAKGAYSQWNLIKVYQDRPLSIDEQTAIKNEAEQKAIKDLLENYEKIAGLSLTPPTNLQNDYKGLVKWYEASILALIEKQTQLAIKLGQDPKKVGKVVTEATKAVFTTSTAIFAAIGVGAGATASTAAAVTAGATAVGGAAFAAAFGPIGIGVLTIVGLLDTLGVFDGDTSQREADAVTYSQLTFVLKKWYEEYAIAASKMNAIDVAEFQKYMQEKYGNVNTVSNDNNGTITNSPASNSSTNSSPTSTNYWYWLLALLIAVLIYLFFKNRNA